MFDLRKDNEGPNPFEPFRRKRRTETVVALAATLLLHLFVFLTLPDQLVFPGPPVGEDERENIEVTLLPPEPDEMRFVEANPDVPENEPDRSDQFSFRAQQAADESPVSGDDAPAVEGEEASQKIVPGAVESPPPVPPGVYSTQARPGEGEGTDGGKAGAQVALAPSPPLPAPSFIRQDPVDEDGPGSSPAEPAEALEPVPEPDPEAPIRITRDAPTGAAAESGDGSGGSPEARPMPRARPRLSPDLISGPLMRSMNSVSRRGTVAIDATFSEFGEYQQQFLAAVQAGWYREIEFFQPMDTAARVHVRMNLLADGTVSDVEIVETTAGEIASLICQTAVEKRSPFRPWTREMVEVFGRDRTLDIVFHYR